jgi:hypothetical protein
VLLISFGLFSSALVGLVWPAFYVLLGGLLDALAKQTLESEAGPAIAAAGVERITQMCFALLGVAAGGFVAGWVSLSCLMYTTERQCNAVRVAWVRSCFAQDATWYGRNDVHSLGTRMTIDIIEYYKGTGERLSTLKRRSSATCVVCVV